MNIKEAEQIVARVGVEFEIEDASFGDRSVQLTAKYVFDSKADAESYVEALKTLIKQQTSSISLSEKSEEDDVSGDGVRAAWDWLSDEKI